MRFSYSNVELKKHPEENWFMMEGEVTNESGRNFNAVCFRVVLYIRAIPVGNVSFIIRGFHSGQTKPFEVKIEELDPRLIPQVTRWEIYPESAY